MLSLSNKVVSYRAFLLITLLGLFCLSAAAQTADKDFPNELPQDDVFGRTRSIIGDDITAGSQAFKFKKPVYRLKRKIERPKRIPARDDVRKPSGTKATPKYDLPNEPKSAEQWETIGVTVWRVAADASPVVEGKETARLLVQEDGKSKEYTPVRANADTVFKLGDKVRLSVEVPRTGYLYIVDREMLSGDKLGEPKLGEPQQVFPTMKSWGGKNDVWAGRLVDIPGQGDVFFKLKSSTPGYLGEMLTIIFSPTPLKDMTVPAEPAFIASDLVNEMEKRYLSDVGEYEQQGTNGQAYTKTEKAAGGSTRQLTQDDPYPQTKYRVKMRPTEPMVINVSLNVK